MDLECNAMEKHSYAQMESIDTASTKKYIAHALNIIVKKY